MDVRLFAFLARQRSATIQSRESFCGLSKRGLAFILANAMFWQPLWVQASEGIVVSAPGTTLGQAGNGVPIVNIAAPNGSGLSHNQFKDYNVASQGVILNNATGRTQAATQLGGIILGNPNLKGKAANTILNEVNGTNPSQLRGYTEVAGQSAKVIVANPHGISCNGCGFINTPQVTLTTGTPVLDHQGRVGRYQVDGGSVSLEGAGLNADNVERFDIITRSARLNAQLHAQELNIVTGRNDVDASTLATTARAGTDQAAPALAIDSTALGGMYAGAIKLVGTEAGVGVRLAGDVVASAGDMQLDANGHLSVAQVSASGAVKVKAASVEVQGPMYSGTEVRVDSAGALVNQQSIAARERVTLQAEGTLSNRGVIEAGVNPDNSRNGRGDVKLTAAQFDNAGKTVVASRNLAVNVRNGVDNRSGAFSAGQVAQFKADSFDNRQQGRLVSGAHMAIDGGQLLNGKGGQVTSKGALDITLTKLDNQAGELSSLDVISLDLGSLDNRAGRILAGLGMALTAAEHIDNRGGHLASQATLGIKAATLNNGAEGRISGNQAVAVSVGRLDQHGGQLTSATDLTLDLNKGRLDNRNGVIAARQLNLRQLADVDNRSGEISSQRALHLVAHTLDNSKGQLYSEQALTLRLDGVMSNLGGLVSAEGLDLAALRLDNREGVVTSDGDLFVALGEGLDNRLGELSSAGVSRIEADRIDNRVGTVSGDNALRLNVKGALDNRQGVLAAGGTLDVDAGSLDNTAQGKVLSDGSLQAKVSGLLNNQAQGLFSAKGKALIDAGQLDNRSGRLSGKDLLTLRGGQWDNRGGKVDANGQLDLHIDSLDNRDHGQVSGQSGIRYKGQALLNTLGLFGAMGDMHLTLTHLDNTAGHVSSGGDLSARIDRLNQQGGKLVTLGQLNLRGTQLDNSQGGLVGAGKGATLEVQTLDNRAGELSAGQSMVLLGQRLDNSAGKLLAGTDLRLKVAQVINQSQGLLSASGELTLDGVGLDNTGGRLIGEQHIHLKTGETLRNERGLITTEGDLVVTAASLDNNDGTLSSAGNLALAAEGGVNNRRGSLAAEGRMTVTSVRLDNRAGEMGAHGALTLTTGDLDNRERGQLTGNGRLVVQAAQVSNGVGSRIASEGAAEITASGLDQQGGELFSKTSLSLDLGSGQLTNRGLINAPVLVLKNLAAVDNQKGEISSAQAVNLSATRLDNRLGKLISNQQLTVRVDQAIANVKGLVSGNGLTLSAASLDNREGLVSSRQALSLSVEGLLDNRQGTLVGDAASRLLAATLDNGQGTVSSKGNLVVEAGRMINAGGSLVGLGQMQLQGGYLDNRLLGLVGGNAAVLLDIAQVDNRGGEITGKTTLGLTGAQLDNSDGGLLVAGTDLSLDVQQLLNRNQGRIEAHTGLTLTGQRLDNEGGRLLSQQDMAVMLTGQALNRAGLINAEGKLALTLLGLDNSAGTLSSAGAMQLAAGGAVLNQGGRLLTDEGLRLTSASLDNSAKGVLASKGGLDIGTGHFDNSHEGSVSSNLTLAIRAGQLDNHDGGRLGSREALTASVTGLDQQGGKLFSDASVHLDLNHGHLDNRAGLINAPLLVLDNLKTVDNRAGEISSAQTFTLAARQLDNGGGRVLSNQALHVRVSEMLSNLKGMLAAQSLDGRVGRLDNSAGTLVSLSGMSLEVDGLLLNRDNGMIEARSNLALSSLGLDNQSGKLLGSAITLDMRGADLDNSGGLITTAGPLTLDNLRKLANVGGELSTARDLRLKAGELDNRNGVLLSEQSLSVTATDIDNQSGLVSGWQGLAVTAQRLDNRQQGTLSSRSGDLEAQVEHALRNSGGGALVAQQRLEVSAASLDNSANGVLSSGAGQRLTVTGTLDNQKGGQIDAGGDLEISAYTLDNRTGRVAAQQGLSLSGTRLDNRAGSLAAQGVLTLDLLADVVNRGGKLASGKALLIQRAGVLDNQGGQIASQGLLTLLVAGLDNSQRGTLAASDLLTLTSTGGVDNGEQGLIYSQHADVNLRAASLANAKGTLQAQGAVAIELDGDLDNQSGKVIAQGGALTLSGVNVDNRGGVLASLKSAFVARSTGVLRNGVDTLGQGGILQALRLDLQTGQLDNRGGRIAALDGDALIRANRLDNRAGGLSASGLLSVTGQDLANGGDTRGEMVGQRIELDLTGALDNRKGILESASVLGINAASLDNQGGQLRALGATGKSRFAIGGLFDNRSGLVEIGSSDLTLGAGLLKNVGGKVLHAGTGTFDIDMANLTRAGGSLVTRGGLTLTADSWTNGSAIQAGRLNLNINHLTQTAGGQLLASDRLEGIGGNWSNDGLIASDGDLSLSLRGTYSGNGRVSSQGSLDVRTAQMALGSNASMTGVGTSNVDVSGLLSNLGRLTSGADMLVSAGRLDNLGTLGSNQRLSVTTASLRNERGLLFSGGDMQLFTGNLTNFYGDVYSLGTLTVARDVAGSWADKLENISGSLESAGDMRLGVGEIENRKEFFKVSGTPVWSSIGMRETGQNSGHMVLQEYYESELEADSPAAIIQSGRDLFILGRNLENSASVISAQRNITATLEKFNNAGTALGTYSVLKSFGLPGYVNKYANKFWSAVMKYNAVNDPDYSYVSQGFESRGTLRSWDANWNESRITPTIRLSSDNDQAVTVGWRHYGTLVSGSAFNVRPAFRPGSPAPLPEQLQGISFFDERIINHGAQVGAANAVIQAGGRVQINATKNLTNSVIREGLPVSGSAAKAFDPKLSTASSSTLITINAQLPPDLARQQVNPLALGSFTLPIGQNGLFRLSGQGGSTVKGASPTWSMGSSSLDSPGREAVAPGVQLGMPKVVDAAVSSLSNQYVERLDHQGGVKGEHASVLSLHTPGATAVDTSVPQRHDGAKGRTPEVTDDLGISSVTPLPGITHVPSSQYVGAPHKYLIETNPVLTELKQFMSSDYLLSGLGYDPDKSWKRLGDGLYEQRLIQQAVVARTGQQFLDGKTSGEQVFKYLMDNAIRSQRELALSVGVGLSAAQVTALTHDIVWMETHQVNGEQVLVPVLYLAQANNRLAPSGALIAGQDVELIAGENLTNAGTLLASRDLSAKAGNDLVNSGLIQAGERLELLAGNNVLNSTGGIIAGRDVSVRAVNGDLINQRDQTRAVLNHRGTSQQSDFLDNAARIEAANDLDLSAGRDVKNIGSVIKSGGDLSISAGRDVSLLAVEQRESFYSSQKRNSTVQQHGATVEAGRDLDIGAGRDINAVASRIEVGRDIAMAATSDLNLGAAAEEAHRYSRGRKVTQSQDRITQVSTVVSAGGDVSLSAGQDLSIVASQVKGGGAVDIDAARDLVVASDQDESASYYLKKSKGSFGRSSSEQKESYHSTNVASLIEAGKDLTINTSKAADGSLNLDGGRNVSIIGSELKAGSDLLMAAAGDVAVLSGIEEHGSFSKKTKSGFLGLSRSGKSQLKTSASQVASELEAGNDAVIAAGGDVRIRASETRAGNDVELRAGLVNAAGDINLVSANDTAYSHSEQYKQKVGLSASNGFLSIASAKESGRQAQTSTSVGSQVVADRDATLQAKRDINVVGSGIDAGRNVSLNAGRDVNVLAAQNQQYDEQWSRYKQVGLGVSGDDNGVSFFAGAEQLKEKQRLEQQTAAASQISAGQDLAVVAGRDINQAGSDAQAVRDIDFTAVRDINIDAAQQLRVSEQQRELQRNGVTATVNHNFGNAKDAANGAGKGDNAVSKVSSTLKGFDAVNQFMAGPTADVKVGHSIQSVTQQTVEHSTRSSTLDAGRDVNVAAGNDVTIKGGQLQAERDINIKGRDIHLDVAKGSVTQENVQRESWGGAHGGTSGGFKVGVGGSYGAAAADSTQGSSTPAQLAAGRDVNLQASRDMNLVGTQVSAGRDIDLKAGNDLNIRAVHNDSSSNEHRHNAGGEAGFAFGSDGVGVYASVSPGEGNLEREAKRHQQAYLYAGDRLNFSSAGDTTIAGADLRGDEVLGRVGGDLKVASLADTGQVKGKESDLNVTVTVGIGAGISGSVGYGKTSGKTHWVDQQTTITGTSKVDVRTENHTQVDGALIAADNGNLKLDTGTLGFSDIAGSDKEHGYYLNVGGSFSKGSGGTTQDASQVGKGDNGRDGKTSWSVSGWEYQKDREQIVRATVGAGEIVVRNDAVTGIDSTKGLNRDLNKAYEITRDQEQHTDLYVTGSSVNAVMTPKQTFDRWKANAARYGENSEQALNDLSDLVFTMSAFAQGNGAIAVNNTLVSRAKMREFTHRDPARRAVIVNGVIADLTHGATTPESQALAQRLTELAGESPEKALQVIAQLRLLSDSSLGQSNWVASPQLAYGTIVGVGAALSAYYAAPNNSEGLFAAASALEAATRETGKDVKHQMEVSATIWTILLGTKLPIADFDPKSGVYDNPIAGSNNGHPVSGGYAEGGGLVTTPHTGGTQLDGQKGDGAYVTPGHQLSPGGMYSEVGDAGEGAKSNSVAEALTSVTQKQLDKKFKHASDFGVVTTKKNPETLAQYESAIKTHMGSTSTTQQGTYGFVKDSKVFFNSTTNNAVVLDASGNFVTGFKLSPGTQQFDNFIKNGVLR